MRLLLPIKLVFISVADEVLDSGTDVLSSFCLNKNYNYFLPTFLG